MSNPPTPWTLPYPQADQRAHEAALRAAWQRVCDSGSYILGTEVEAFENEFATFLGAGQTVGVASGTDAIELMLRALDVGAGGKVVVPSFAPSAVAAAVMRAGAEPVFADIEPDTLTLCPASLDAVLRSPQGRGAKAAVVVHLYGHPADWGGLQKVAHEHGIELVEDCAQSHGAAWQGRMTGTLGKAAAFSFYPTKNLAALGDAGAVAMKDPELGERVRVIRQYGWKKRYISDQPGVNSRLDELQAAVLRVKLGALKGGLQQRRRLAAVYDVRLRSGSVVSAPKVRGGCEHAYHQYVVRAPRRDAVVRHLQELKIPVAVHYPQPLHRQRAFGKSEVALPESERAAATVMSLPLHPYLDEAAVGEVCDAIGRYDDAQG